MANKRILIFSLSYYPIVGGAEVAVNEITSRIGSGEIEWDMVTLRFDPTHKKFERVGEINVHRIGGGLGYLSKVLFVPQAAVFAFRRRYDAYWAMMTYMLFPVGILRLLGKRTPYALTLQDGDPFSRVFERARISIFKPLLKYGFRNAKVIQSISNFLAENWAKPMGFRGAVEVIPNGVDVKKFSDASVSKPSNKTVLVTTSRLVEKNAVGNVIEAMKHLPESFIFRIVGAGPLEGKLKAQAEALGVSKRVEFAGHVDPDKIPEELHKAHIFIRPSLSEGMGNSFIEAMAAGIPVIATPVGGIPDFLIDGETGLFVEPKSPRLIAFQVEMLARDRVLRDKIVINAKRMVSEKYEWDLIARDMKERVFDKI